jgi:MFS family permease
MAATIDHAGERTAKAPSERMSSNEGPPQQITRFRARSLLTLAVLCITVASSSALQLAFSPFQEDARADLHLSDFQVGLTQGLAAAIPVLLLAIPMGRLADRGSRVKLLIAMSLTWIAGTMWTAFSRDFVSLFAARMLASVGAVAIAAIMSMAADVSPPGSRGKTNLILNLGTLAGKAGAFAVGGWLSGVLANPSVWLPLPAWRAVHLVFAAAGTLALIPLLFTPEPERTEVGDAPAGALRRVLGELWARRGFLLPLYLGMVGVVMADTAASIWASPVLIRDFHLQPVQFGGWMGLVMFVPGVAGSAIGALTADGGRKLKVRGGPALGAALAAAISIPASLFPILPTVAGFAWALGLLLFCGAVAAIVTSTLMTTLLPNELRGMCVGGFILLSALVGFALAPAMVSVVSLMMGGESKLAPALAVTATAMSAISFIGFVLTISRLPQSPTGDAALAA